MAEMTAAERSPVKQALTSLDEVQSLVGSIPPEDVFDRDQAIALAQVHAGVAQTHAMLAVAHAVRGLRSAVLQGR